MTAGLVLGGPALAQDKKKLSFVVNASSDFWKLAEAGVKKAQGELSNYQLQFRYPAQGTAAAQNSLMDDLVTSGVAAIMISSADPKNSIDAFNRIAAQVPLFTTDSDSSLNFAVMGTVILIGVLVDQQWGSFHERRRIREAARTTTEAAD